MIVFSIVLISCTKKQKFKRAIHSKWNIDKIEYGAVSSGCGADYYNIVSELTEVGTMTFTKNKTESKVAYSTSDKQFEGIINYNSGGETTFTYEYFEKVYGGHQLTIFDNQYTGLETHVLTNKKWIFTLNDYNGDCYYNTITYSLSK